jgi:hypothetical protein
MELRVICNIHEVDSILNESASIFSKSRKQTYFAQLPLLRFGDLLRLSGCKLKCEKLFCLDLPLGDRKGKRRRRGQRKGEGGLELHVTEVTSGGDKIPSLRLSQVLKYSGLFIIVY